MVNTSEIDPGNSERCGGCGGVANSTGCSCPTNNQGLYSMSETMLDNADSNVAIVKKEYNPLALIDKAIDRGIGADELSKLVLLAEHWQAQRAKEAFQAAMNRAQKRMPVMLFNARNGQTNSSYATLESIQQKARPIYTEEGFSLSFGEGECPLPNQKRTICDVSHVDGHCQQYHIDLPIDGIGPKGNPIGGMNAVQGACSTMSYGQRRLLTMIFNITVAGEDRDGNTLGFITEEQVTQINNKIEECKRANKAVDFPALLKYLAVDSLDELPSRDFRKAMDALSTKLGAKR